MKLPGKRGYGLSRKQWITLIVMLGIFVFFATTFSTSWITAFDSAVGDGIRTLRSDVLTPIFILITDMGEFLQVLIVGIVFALFAIFVLKLRWKIVIMAAAVLCSLGTNRLLKAFFARPRPTVEHLSFADGYSFPSGHAMISTTFYGLLGFLLWQYFKEHGKPVLARCILVVTIIWTILICVSRIYLGVHFPSDILAGAALGFAWFIAATAVMEKVKR
ncbi:phosphatase PAP2 family protein [Paenibacillus albiflavus]|uniref:Phosphatase PAP2 family protein n=1 Tax=Paenibacillus albiflavus TaxID=2545760 RepID=A0A4R4EHP7_9BACL|nr:phosphatase PAP2 family protein [Paenibacillus albiflavus]